MIIRHLKTFAAASLAAPMLATAAVTWHFEGTIVTTSVPAPISVGDPFFLDLSFDPAAIYLGYNAPNDHYTYTPSSISMTFGTATVGPFIQTWNGIDDTGALWVRDDSLFFGSPARDGLVFDLDQANGDGTTDQFLLRLYDPDLSLIANHLLPAAPDPKWVQGNAPGDVHTFEICLNASDCTGGDLLVNLTSVSAVPEPGTAALLMAGLGGVTAWSRQRRRTK